MKTTQYALAAVLALAVMMFAAPAPAVTTFISDGFEYVNVAALQTAGWSIVNTAAVTDLMGTWGLITGDHSDKEHYNPPTIDGTPSTGKFMISSVWDPNRTDLANMPDTGASHDFYTPTFSTTGTSNVWLHADVAAMLDQEGKAIFDIEVSTDSGATWDNALHRVCPGREHPGSWYYLPPSTTFPATTENADGFFGHLDLDLSTWAADAADVQVRFRHYEPYRIEPGLYGDWWVRLDNVVIDDVPVLSGRVTVFEEGFDRPEELGQHPAVHWLGQMLTDGDFETGASVITWVTTGSVKVGEEYIYEEGHYVPGEVGDGPTWDHNVNRLEHYGPAPYETTPNPNPDFAYIHAGYRSDYSADEYMMTPVLDLTEMESVFLEYEDETWLYRGRSGNVQDQYVLLMRDTDADGPDKDDEVVRTIFYYDEDAVGTEDGEDPWYAERLFSVPEAAGSDDMFFAWHYIAYNAPWWAIDSIVVTGNPELLGDANHDGVVDDKDATILAQHWHLPGDWTFEDGDFNYDTVVDEKDASILASHWHMTAEGGAPSVPEPSTLALLAGAAAMAWLGRRRRW